MGQTVVIGSVAYVVEMLIAVSYFNRIFERKRKSGYVFWQARHCISAVSSFMFL